MALDTFKTTRLIYDRHDHKISQKVFHKEGSTGRLLEVQLINGGKAENTSGISAYLVWQNSTKKDLKGVVPMRLEVAAEGVYRTEMPNMGSGLIWAYIKLMEGEKPIGLATFKIEAEGLLFDEAGVGTTPEEKTILDDILSTVSTYDQDILSLRGQLADNAISPDDFDGTDGEKVQQAINYAQANRTNIRFSRMYDITGMTIIISKSGMGRRMLTLIGAGGGIKKLDSGYIFSAPNADIGDVVSSTMKYESVAGSGCKVWDCNKLIRITSSLDSYVDVDTIVDASERYVQTVKFFGVTVTGGNGWAFEWLKSYDTLIHGCTIEHRQHGIRNTGFASNPDNNTLRIVDNVIEGLFGKAIELGSSYGVTIKGNYFELNTGGYVDLSKTSNYHNGLVIEGNTFQMSPTQDSSEVPAIDLKGIGNQGVVSKGNVSSGVLYKLYYDGTQGRLISEGDVSYTNQKSINAPTQLVELGRLTNYSTGVGFGRVAVHKFSSSMVAFLPGETKEITVPVNGITLVSDDMVTVRIGGVTGSYDVTVLHERIDPSTNSVTARVRNDSVGNQNISVSVRILQIK